MNEFHAVQFRHNPGQKWQHLSWHDTRENANVAAQFYLDREVKGFGRARGEFRAVTLRPVGVDFVPQERALNVR